MVRYRLNRLSEEIKKEIADVMANELTFSTDALLSVLKVDVSKDLKHAKIYISTIGSEIAVEKNLEILKKAAGFIRHELAQRLPIRMVPELTFLPDDSIAHSIKITKIIEELKD